MKELDPKAITARDNYKLLTGSIIPRPVAFVTTLSKDGIVNAAPFSYFNIVSANPPLVSISVQRDEGKRKDTAEHAIDRGEFVVHITTESYVEEVNKTASRMGPEESELDVTQLTLIESKKVGVPGVQEAPIRMECVIEQAISLGGDKAHSPTCDLLIGRIVYYYIQDDLYEEGRIRPDSLKPVGRLAGNDYVKLGEIFELVRPK